VSQVNTAKPRPLDYMLSILQQKLGLDKAGVQLFRDVFSRVDTTLNDDGSVKSTANVSGRSEQLQTTLGHVDNTGKLDSLGNVVDTSTDHLTDGTGSPLTGGKRGFNALDANNRLVGSFRSNAVNIAGTPTGATGLSNNGVLTAITVAAQTQQFGDGAISYSSGSVDPGAFGTFYVFADDPTFAGGAVTYQFSTTPVTQTAANGRVLFGKITTVNGSAKTGGGNTGGTTSGGAGGRGFIQ